MSPGFLLTKLLDPFISKGDGQQAGKVWEEYEARQGRKATFDEIGDVVVLLSTPRMSLVVGHNLVIDGYVACRGRVGCALMSVQGIHHQREHVLGIAEENKRRNLHGRWL